MPRPPVGSNDASFNTGNGFNDGIIVTRHLASEAITYAALLSTIFGGQVQTYTNTGSGGGTGNYLNLGGLKLCWGITGTQTFTSAGSITPVTFPSGFFSSITFGKAWEDDVSVNTIAANLNQSGISTSGITMYNGNTSGSSKFQWIAIGT